MKYSIYIGIMYRLLEYMVYSLNMKQNMNDTSFLYV